MLVMMANFNPHLKSLFLWIFFHSYICKLCNIWHFCKDNDQDADVEVTTDKANGHDDNDDDDDDDVGVQSQGEDGVTQWAKQAPHPSWSN